jgi:CBS-domain-containing membrane protein
LPGDRREQSQSRAIAVHEVMARYPVTAREDDDASAALSAMSRGRVRRLPVLDSAGRLAGMVWLDDIVIRGIEMAPSRQARSSRPCASCTSGAWPWSSQSRRRRPLTQMEFDPLCAMSV